MAIMIIYNVHTFFYMSPLVKGRLVVVSNLVLRVSRFKSQKTRILFVFCSHLGEDKKGGRLDSLFSFALFSPSLPFLRLPHRLPLIVFFIEIWQSGRGRPPCTCLLPTHTNVRDMRVSQAGRRENADRTHVEKSENRIPCVVRITLYWLFGSFLLLCSAVTLGAVVSPGRLAG